MWVRLDRYRSSILAISIACTVVGIRAARAENPEAREWFDKGTQAMKAGKLDEACSAFERANEIEPGAGTLILLGTCREQNHQLASAQTAYREALARVKDPSKRKFAQEHVAALQSRLSYVTIAVPEPSRLDGLTITRNDKPFDREQWNRAVPVDGGNSVVIAQASGYLAWRIEVQVPDEGGQTRVEIPRLVALTTPEPAAPEAPVQAEPAAPKLVPPATGTTATVPPEPARAATPHASIFTTRRVIGSGVAAAGVGAVIVGAVLGRSADQKQADAQKLCPNSASCEAADAANAANRAARQRALQANIAFGVAGAAAIAAGILWFTGAPDEARGRVTVVPTIGPGSAGIAFTGRL